MKLRVVCSLFRCRPPVLTSSLSFILCTHTLNASGEREREKGRRRTIERVSEMAGAKPHPPHPDGDLRDYVEPELWDRDGFSPVITGAIIIPKVRREVEGDITIDQFKQMRKEGQFDPVERAKKGKKPLPVWLEHNGKWQIGEVVHSLFLGGVGYLKAKLDLKEQDGRFSYNLMRAGYAPAFSLGHRPLDRPEAVEVSLVGAPRRPEGWIVQYTKSGMPSVHASLFSGSAGGVDLPENSPYGNGKDPFEVYSIPVIRASAAAGSSLSTMAAPVGKGAADGAAAAAAAAAAATGATGSATGAGGVGKDGGGRGGEPPAATQNGGDPTNDGKKTIDSDKPAAVGKRTAAPGNASKTGAARGAPKARGAADQSVADSAKKNAETTEVMDDDEEGGGGDGGNDSNNTSPLPAPTTKKRAAAAAGAGSSAFDKSEWSSFVQNEVQKAQTKWREELEAERKRTAEQQERKEWRGQMDSVTDLLEKQIKENPAGVEQLHEAMKKWKSVQGALETEVKDPTLRRNVLDYYKASATAGLLKDGPVGKKTRQEEEEAAGENSGMDPRAEIAKRFRPPGSGTPASAAATAGPSGTAAAAAAAAGWTKPFAIGGVNDPKHSWVEWRTAHAKGTDLYIPYPVVLHKFNASAGSSSSGFNPQTATPEQCAEVVAAAFLKLPESALSVRVRHREDGTTELVNQQALAELGKQIGVDFSASGFSSAQKLPQQRQRRYW